MNTTTVPLSALPSPLWALRTSTAVLGILVYTAGFTGDFLALLLFMQKQFRQVSTGLIFLLLNIFSAIHLLSLVVEFLDSIFQIEVINSEFRCQFILWVQNASRTMCACLATTISVDRFIRSEYPMRSRIWCTTKNVQKLFIIYFLVSVLFYAFFYYPLNVFNDSYNCTFPYGSAFRLFTLNIMPPIRFLSVCVLPTVIMVGCGARMLFNIRNSKGRIKPQAAKQQGSSISTVTKPSVTSVNTRRETAKLDKMLLLMVSANVIAYIVTQIPFNIYTVINSYDTSSSYSVYSLLRAFLLMWSSIYFGIGFYLFCATSTQFRKEFLAKIRCVYCS